MEPIKFPSIGQFRNLIKDIQFAYKEELPTLKMTGTVKVHGTNASVVIDGDGKQYPQSRNNVLTVENDNLGFAAWHHDRESVFYNFESLIIDHIGFAPDSIIIYGEFAGKGIQKGVAVSDADRFFYVFNVKIIKDGKPLWIKDYPSLQWGGEIVDARSIWIMNVDIDFNVPGKSQNELVEITSKVEEMCPVGLYFGFKGIGEGVVWEHITDGGERLSFKVKGEKHSVTKVKKLAEVDTEKMNSIDEFINYAVTENRLNQGYQEVCNGEQDRKLMGKFIKWVSDDVNKEESDTMKDNGLTMKDIGSALSRKTRNWFFSQEAI